MSKSLFNEKYRTGVVNDFSIVTKAVFYIFQIVPGKVLTHEKYDLIDKLPVQINPESFHTVYSGKQNSMDGILGPPSEYASGLNSNSSRSDIRINLYYDLYDEYNITTSDGLSGGDSFLALSDLSLTNEEVTSLPKLINYTGSSDKCALFKWGQFKFFGFISNIDCDYTAFSRWGEPLKCKAEVTLDEIYLGDNFKGKNFLATCFGEAAVEIKTYEEASNTLNTLALGGLQALR